MAERAGRTDGQRQGQSNSLTDLALAPLEKEEEEEEEEGKKTVASPADRLLRLPTPTDGRTEGRTRGRPFITDVAA